MLRGWLMIIYTPTPNLTREGWFILHQDFLRYWLWMKNDPHLRSMFAFQNLIQFKMWISGTQACCTARAKDAFFIFFFEMVAFNVFCVLLLFLHRNSISFSSNEPMSQEKVKKINHNKSLEIKSLNNNKSLTLHHLSQFSI